MRGKLKNIMYIITILSLAVILSACSSKFADGDPYYYELFEIKARKQGENVNNMYVIDPFAGKVLTFSPGVETYDELPYELEKYEETEEELIIHFEKKSSSLWKSLETDVEYSVEKIDGEFDYTKVQRP